MRPPRLMAFGVVAVFLPLLLPSNLLASKRNPADFPLRVHVYECNQIIQMGPSGGINFVDGTGRANLIENGEPKGFDFSFRCLDHVNYSSGYETYLARWKKPNAVLEILVPVMGKPNATNACELKVALKDGLVYHTHNGRLLEQPAAIYKKWMEKVQFDPEHGKNEPISPATATPAAPVSAAPKAP